MKKIIPAFIFLLVAYPAHADIVWANVGPYTGSVAAIGLSQQEGVKQAVEDINAKGGINGQKIVLKDYDDACDPKQAVVIANKIASEDIKFVLGGSCSSSVLAASKIYADEKIVLLTTQASNFKVTDQGNPYLFRAMYRDDHSASALATYVLKHYKDKKLAIIHDRSTYGQGIAENFKRDLNQNGFQEIFFEPYDPTNHDYSTLVTHIKQSGAEILFTGGFPVEIGIITRQLREADSNIQIIAGDLTSPDYWRVAGGTGEGALFTFPPDPRKESGAKNVIDIMEKKGMQVDGYTLYAYAAAQILAQAQNEVGLTVEKVSEAIHTKQYPTILGVWSFDEKGDRRNIRQIIYHWHEGHAEEIKE